MPCTTLTSPRSPLPNRQLNNRQLTPRAAVPLLRCIISIALKEQPMRRLPILLLAIVACAPVAPPNSPAPLDEEHPRLEWGLVLHGGAGVTRTSYSAAELPLMEAAFHQALRAGHAILARGGSSLDTVEAAVRV